MSEAVFLRVLGDDNKATALAEGLHTLSLGNPNSYMPSVVHIKDTDLFKLVPGIPFVYWVSERVLRLFAKLPQLRVSGRSAQHGLSTKDDFRFVRLWWEVAPEATIIGDVTTGREEFCQQTYSHRYWIPFAKGGSYSPFYSDLHLVVNWAQNGQELESALITKYPYLNGDANWVLHRECDYFQSGLTWSRRPHRRGAFSHVPKGVLFSDSGPMLFLPVESHWAICALLNSDAYIGMLHLLMPRGGISDNEQTLKYEVGYVASVPVPNLDSISTAVLDRLAKESYNLKREIDTANETSHFFHLPALLQVPGATLADRVTAWQARLDAAAAQLIAREREINDITFHLYGITDDDRKVIEDSLGKGPGTGVQRSGDGAGVDEEVDLGENEAEDAGAEIAFSDARSLVRDFVSYVLGAVFGRWDVRNAEGSRSRPALPDPVQPLPVCTPGMLQGADDVPLHEDLSAYQHTPHLEGILVDDPGHSFDIIGRIREVLDVIWGEQVDSIYQESIEILAGGGHDLRPWFRATFFEQHIQRYSKSRRKAPIYWCLSTPSRSYGVWCYYHRLSKDTLYKMLQDYVEPKLRDEARRLAALRTQGGENPTESQRKAIDTEDALVAELTTFRDELARVAPLWNPDLNDGVILNFAPLWRLAPHPRSWQKECKETWEKLTASEYDWSHLAMHLWPARVVPRCAEDRSLAIAHGLQDEFWAEDASGKWRPRQVSPARMQALIAERQSPAVAAALVGLRDAALEVAPARKTTARPAGSGAGSRRSRKPKAAIQTEMALASED